MVKPQLLRLDRTRVSAQAIPGSPSFRGTAATTSLGPVTLQAGLTIVRVQSNGTQNFAASLIQPEPGTGPNGPPVTGGFAALFDQIGAFKGGTGTVLGVPGDYYVQILASGAFQLSIEQPLPENVNPVQQASFTAKGVDVSPYFVLPDGISQISCQTASTTLLVYLYHLDDLGGEAIVAGVQGYQATIFDFRDPNNQPSFPISLPDDGPYILATNNDLNNQGAWTIAFS
jgi:hypothetical protein